jgi:hypothetical protein
VDRSLSCPTRSATEFTLKRIWVPNNKSDSKGIFFLVAVEQIVPEQLPNGLVQIQLDNCRRVVGAATAALSLIENQPEVESFDRWPTQSS